MARRRVFLASLLLAACGGGGSGSSGGPTPPTVISGPSGPTATNGESPFRSLAVHPTNPDIVLLGTEANGFVRSTDGGASWTRQRQGLRHLGSAYPEIYDIAFAPSDPAVVYAATTAGPGPATDPSPSAVAGVYKSVDGGSTWTQVNSGLTSTHLSSVVVDPLDANLVLAGVSGGNTTSTGASTFVPGGLFRSTNGGTRWTYVSSGPDDTRNAYPRLIARGNAPRRWLTIGVDGDDASRSQGVTVSTDSGASWSRLGDAIRAGANGSFDASADGQVIYAGEWPIGPFRVHMSVDGGASWSTIAAPGNRSIAVSPVDPMRVLLEGGGTLFLSEDGLATWRAVANPGPFFEDVAFAPSDPNIVYAVTRGYLFFRSDDGGSSFTLLKDIRRDVLNVIP